MKRLLAFLLLCLFTFNCLSGCGAQPGLTESVPHTESEVDGIGSEETSSVLLTDRVAPVTKSEGEGIVSEALAYIWSSERASPANYSYGDQDVPVTHPQTGQNLNFKVFSKMGYEILDILYDSIKKTYAVVYFYTTDFDNKPYQNHSLYNYPLMIQMFNSHGFFVKEFCTNIYLDPDHPRQPFSEIPFYLSNGLLTFYLDYSTSECYFFDTIKESYFYNEADLFLSDGKDTLLCEIEKDSNTANSVYTFTMLHNAVPTAMMNFTTDESVLWWGGPGGWRDRFNLFSFDPKNKTAFVGTDTLKLKLDFNTGTYEEERTYKKEHLTDCVATSSNGEWEVYLADLVETFYYYVSNIVIYNTKTKAITYLTSLIGDSITFGSDSLLLINYEYFLLLYDLETEKYVDTISNMDYRTKKCYVTGITSDNNKDWFLVSYLAYNYDSDEEVYLPIMLDVYDRQGRLINTITSNLMVIQPSYYPEVFSLVIDGKGSVTISDFDKELGSIQYYIPYID